MSIKLSSAEEFHFHALPEPDVNLSIHPAPIVQPLTPAPNGQTGQVARSGPATTTAMLAPCVRRVFCICVAPIARGNHPVCAMRDAVPKREIVRSNEPIPAARVGSSGRSHPRPDRCDDAAASDAFSAASLWPLSRSLRVRNWRITFPHHSSTNAGEMCSPESRNASQDSCPPVGVLAVHDLGLVRVKFQVTLHEALPERILITNALVLRSHSGR